MIYYDDCYGHDHFGAMRNATHKSSCLLKIFAETIVFNNMILYLVNFPLLGNNKLNGNDKI